MDRGLACQAEVGGCSGAAARCLRALLGWDGLERAAHSQGHRRFVVGLLTCSLLVEPAAHCRNSFAEPAGGSHCSPQLAGSSGVMQVNAGQQRRQCPGCTEAAHF